MQYLQYFNSSSPCKFITPTPAVQLPVLTQTPVRYSPKLSLPFQFQICSTRHNLSNPTDDSQTSFSTNRDPRPLSATITSTSNPFVKHCAKLRQSSSYRHSHASLLVLGITPISEICKFENPLFGRPIVECLLVLDDYDIPEELNALANRVIRVTSAVIKRISGVHSIDCLEVIAVMKTPSTFQIVTNSLHEEDCTKWFPIPHRILVLDGIQDPGNLGTLLRSAAAFGWGGVFLLPGCCDPFNDKSLRACRGACFQIPIISGKWSHLENLRRMFEMKMLAGHPAKNGLEPVMSLSTGFVESIANSRVCLVLGSEGGGLSEVSKKCCELVSIPMAGEYESLNVSVAGGIFMYMLQVQPDE